MCHTPDRQDHAAREGHSDRWDSASRHSHVLVVVSQGFSGQSETWMMPYYTSWSPYRLHGRFDAFDGIVTR